MELINKILSKIEPVCQKSYQATLAKQDTLTKPQGSLGQLEKLSAQICGITASEKPQINRKVIFTLAGDHGVTAEGVSAFPKEVTPQMVYNFVSGGAAINVLARQAGAEVIIGDLGVAVDLDICHPSFCNKKVAYGTKNMAIEPAMSRAEAVRAIESGIELFVEANSKQKIDLTAIGEMGIGNSTPATAILALLSGKSVEHITGKGTGLNSDGINRKISAITKALTVNKIDKNDGIDILSKIGGFEIGGMAGIILAAAAHKVPVVIDGFISTSAALIAAVIEPKCKDYLVASHSSEEGGHKYMLEILDKKPLLNLGLRLGEGTGAALAMPLICSAVAVLNEMASFGDAGVSEKE